MRRLSVLLLTATAVLPVATVLPVLPQTAARAHPVAASLSSVPLSGVDPAAAAAVGAAAARAAGVAQASRPAVLTAQRSTGGFQTLGVSWNATLGAAPTLAVAVRTHGSTGWTAWTALAPDDADAVGASAVAAGLRGGTAPTWVGPSDGVQVRVDVRRGTLPAGLRVDLLDPGSSDYDAVAGTSAAEPAGAAAAAAGQPTILSRAAWGADESKVRAAPTYAPSVAAGVIHHTADSNSYTPAQVPGILRSDYAYHLSRGWNDLGYNFVVDKFGRTWEGRAGGIARAVVGAHAGGFNWMTFGVALIGNYMTVEPSTAAVAAIERLFAWKLDLDHRDPLGSAVLTAGDFSGGRWPAGTKVTLPVVMGHRDVDTTDCPGTQLYALLPAIRRAVTSLMGAALVTPGLSPVSGAYPSSGATVSARALTAQSWTLSVTQDCYQRRVATVTGSVAARGVVLARWAGGAAARPGTYTLRLDSRSRTSAARPVLARYTVTAPPPAAPASGTATTGAGGYVPVTAARLLDTRSGPVTALGAGGRVDVPVLGRGGVPGTGVRSVVLSVVGVCPTAPTVLTAWPAGTAQPAASTLNLPPGGIRSALVTVPVGAGGAVSVANAAGSTDLVVDVVGYVSATAAARYLPVTAAVYDSRTDPRGVLGAGESRVVGLPTIAGLSGYRLTALVVHLGTHGAPGRGNLLVRPFGSAATAVSTVNYEAGEGTALAVVQPASGRLLVDNRGGPLQVSIDAVGLWTADPSATGRLTSLPGERVLDTRSAGGPIPAAGVRDVPVTTTATTGASTVPDDAQAVVVNLTAVGPAAATRLLAWPTGGSRPARADLQPGAHDVRAGVAIVPVGAGGRISLFSSAAATNVVVDVIGYVR